jgi:hypothetical protein
MIFHYYQSTTYYQHLIDSALPEKDEIFEEF